MLCPQCGYAMDAFDKECPRCHGAGALQAQQVSPAFAAPVTASPNGEVLTYNFETVPEAKLVIKELKLKKKEFQLAKREITAQIAQVRAAHRGTTTRMASPVRLGGTFGKIMRATERVGRYSARTGLNNALTQLESDKSALDTNIAQIDGAILQLERFILENSA